MLPQLCQVLAEVQAEEIMAVAVQAEEIVAVAVPVVVLL